MSTLKLINSLQGNPGVHTGRMMDDFMPARGNFPLMREEEFEELAVTTYDAGARLFEITNAKDAEALQGIIDKRANGWYVISVLTEPYFAPQADGSVRGWVWCIWSAPYKELNTQRGAAAAGIGVR